MIMGTEEVVAVDTIETEDLHHHTTKADPVMKDHVLVHTLHVSLNFNQKVYIFVFKL